MYELIFWKYLEGVYLNHQEVYESLDEESNWRSPVQVILNRIASVFAKWEKVDANSWKNNSGVGAFKYWQHLKAYRLTAMVLKVKQWIFSKCDGRI
jgi:hypothetical protein